MSDITISVENLSKKFRIGTGNSPGYHRASEFISGLPRAVWNNLRSRNIFSPRPASGRGAGGEGLSASLQPPASSLEHQPVNSLQPSNEFWALKDVSFEVKQGEVVGIIGRNGAGKSTLLKILSRITEPTSGRFGIRGRVASLLEVGTGFHPELTGRENIFVSGITLGMTRAEIKKRFEEIVDFSGVEKFLDTPVKHYSSGMQVRLGFAVAAHLESEILIVDEVLAVGDAGFQRKCFGKMGEVAQSGRTVMLVSHNLHSIRTLCDTAVLIEQGKVVLASDSISTSERYLQSSCIGAPSRCSGSELFDLPPDPVIKIEKLEMRQQGGRPNLFRKELPIEITIEYCILSSVKSLRIYFDILDDNENLLVRTFHDDDYDHPAEFRPGSYTSAVVIPGNWLGPFRYKVVFRAGIHNVRPCFNGNQLNLPLLISSDSSMNRAYPGEPVRSILQPKLTWITEPSRTLA